MFFLIMIILGYDISKRTTFPGSKKLLIETILPSDSTKADTTNVIIDKTTVEKREKSKP